MNTVAHTFEALVSTARHCPESDTLEVHTVNLVSQLAVLPERKSCVALVCKKTFPRYQGFQNLVRVLEPYQVQLSKRPHPKGGFFLFAELLDDEPSSFAGACVRVLEPDDSLAAEVSLKVAA